MHVYHSQVLLQLYLEFRHKQHSKPPQSSHETTIHFIETAPSVLREIPWLRSIEHKVITRRDTVKIVSTIYASRKYTAEILWLSIILVLICGTWFIIDVHYIYFQREELSVTQNIINICNKTMNVQANDDIGCIQLVYGLPGMSQACLIFPQIPQNNCFCNVLP